MCQQQMCFPKAKMGTCTFQKRGACNALCVGLHSESDLAALAVSLGATRVGTLSQAETAIVSGIPSASPVAVKQLSECIEAGHDPLGELFCALRTPDCRRKQGAVYTPRQIVKAMLDWAQSVGSPQRVVDPGAGSGRFLVEAGRRFADADLVAVENDPLAALLVRANLAAAGLAGRATVRLEDYRTTKLGAIPGRTLYIGNPPYVRHHQIDAEWKDWLKEEAAQLGFGASALAGLHVHFFLAIARYAKAGDYGALITASEWLDVNYGQLVRELFLNRLGGQAVYIIEPDAEPFPGTQSTAAVTTFTVNGKPKSARFARIDRLDDLDHLSGGRRVCRDRLAGESRWSYFTRTKPNVPEGYVELGELFRVHRGQVTGANRVWIEGDHSDGLPGSVLFRAVTKARELFCAGTVLSDGSSLRRVIDLPEDLSAFSNDEREAILEFLKIAEYLGAKDAYTAQHRNPWWSVNLREPAPILATYMARRPPAFVLNKTKARHINVAHGLYPRERFKHEMIFRMVKFLRDQSTLDGGRVYAGGLTKFEPREMERIPVPAPNLLMEIDL